MSTLALAALMTCAVWGRELASPADLGAQGAAAAEATEDTLRLPTLRAEVRRSLLDPGLARSAERLEPGRELLPFGDLSEWLASRASVKVRGYGGGGRQVLSVRGSRPGAVLVLLDGLPINDPLTGEADISTVPLSSLASATLVRGAGTARYGSGALGGALLLRSAGSRDARPAARLTVGSLGAYEASGSAAWAATDSRDAAGIRFDAGIRGAENDFTYTNRLAADSPEQRRGNADSRLTWAGLSGGTDELRATLRFDDLERGVPGRLGTSAFAGDRWSETRWTATATAGAAGNGDATGRLGLRRLGLRYMPGDGAPASAQRALDVRAAGEVALPGLADLVVGGRLSLEQLQGDGIAGRPDRLAGGLTLRRVFGAGRRQDPRGGEGFVVEPVLGFDVSDGEAALSPELGASYRADEHLRLYGRLGRAYRVPTFADLHFEAAPGVRANPELEAEKVVLDTELGLELGARVSRLPVSLRVAGWVRDTRRPIVWLASSAALWSPRNLDRLLAHGLDLQGRLEAAGSAPFQWAFEGGVTLQRSRVGFGDNRNPLPYEPDVAGRAALEFRRGTTAGRLELRYTGSRSTTVAATRRLDGFVTLDAGIRRRFEPGPLVVDVTLGVHNLTDTSYELVELFPEPGRVLRLTLDVH
jgi:iron complex outermembrane receptor protein